MADINLNIVNKLSKNGSVNKSTVGKKNNSIKDTKGLSGVSSIGNKNLLSSLKSAGTLKSLGAVGVAIKVATKVADKSVDLYATYQSAKTGQRVHYSNVKARKDTFLSLGTNLIRPAIRNEFIVKKEIERQNIANDYGREIYNLNNYGEKYKSK